MKHLFTTIMAVMIGTLLSMSTYADQESIDYAVVAPELRQAAQNINLPPITKELLNQRQPPAPWTGTQNSEVSVTQRNIPSTVKTDPDITIYIINAEKGANRPGILHTHGGGFVMGSAQNDIAKLQTLASQLDCVIVTVEYRLAPETTYQGSIEDNYSGLLWMHNNASELGLDNNRIAVMGESAGGGHAALLAITARDRQQVPVMFQMLIYPMLDDRTATSREVPDHIGQILWTREYNRIAWEAFLGQTPGVDDVPQQAVPARTKSVADLPPAFIGVGSIDLFVEEDISYALRLINSGVTTELMVVPGAYHAFDWLAPESSLTKQFNERIVAALQQAFNPTVK